MSDRPQVNVEQPVAWVLADNLTFVEIDEINRLCAAKNANGLHSFLWAIRGARNYGIDPDVLYNHLYNRYLLAPEEQVQCPCCEELGVDDPRECSFCADEGHDHSDWDEDYDGEDEE